MNCKVIMDAEAMERALKRIAHQVIEKTNGAQELVFIGIKRRGVSIAKEIAGYIKEFEGKEVPIGVLDITFYRDDLSEQARQPVVSGHELDFKIDGKKIVLVDDVLFTGRTARAAMDAIMDMGRPSYIKFAVLVDRGHRELPIRADFVGKNVPTSKHEIINVNVLEFDNLKSVEICKMEK